MSSARKNGYTLVELLVVISITSLLTVLAIVNYKVLSNTQILTKAVGQAQTVLRLAQANATSQTLCSDNQNVGPWSVTFNSTTMTLSCGPTSTTQKTYTIESVQLSDTANSAVGIFGSACGNSAPLPLTVSFAPGTGALTFSFSGAQSNCLTSPYWTFNFSKVGDSSQTKSFNLSSGGAIDLQQPTPTP